MSSALLAVKVGGRTIRENLEQAIGEGRLVQHEDGTFQLTQRAALPKSSRWLGLTGSYSPPAVCLFLGQMIFKYSYAKSTVPQGCRNCYKVKVGCKTLRQLVALVDILGKIECRSKCGTEIGHLYTQDIYSGVFYCNSLDHAREIYPSVREAVDATSNLGPHLPIGIRRGCAAFEIFCGPSDQYTFRPELSEVEAYLLSRYRDPIPTPRMNKELIMLDWIKTAFSIGDDTYLDFTGGKPLFPKSVTYPVVAPPTEGVL